MVTKRLNEDTARKLEIRALQSMSKRQAQDLYDTTTQIIGLDRAATFEEFDEIAAIWELPRSRRLAPIFSHGFRELRANAVLKGGLTFGRQKVWTSETLVKAARRIVNEDGLSTPFTGPLLDALSKEGRIGTSNTVARLCSDPGKRNGIANLNRSIQFAPSTTLRLPKDFCLAQFLDRMLLVHRDKPLVDIPSRDRWNSFARPRGLPSVRAIIRNLCGPNSLRNFSEVRVVIASLCGGEAKYSGRWNHLPPGPKQLRYQVPVPLDPEYRQQLLQSLRQDVWRLALTELSYRKNADADALTTLFESPSFVSRSFIDLLGADAGLPRSPTERLEACLSSEQGRLLAWGLRVCREGRAPDFFSTNEVKALVEDGEIKSPLSLSRPFGDEDGRDGLHNFRVQISRLLGEQLPVHHWTYRRIVKAASRLSTPDGQVITTEQYEQAAAKLWLPSLERLRDVAPNWATYIFDFRNDVARKSGHPSEGASLPRPIDQQKATIGLLTLCDGLSL